MRVKKELLDGDLIDEEAFNQSLQSYLGILSHCQGHKVGMKLRKDLGLKEETLA